MAGGRAVVRFDADTSALNAKVEASKRKMAGITGGLQKAIVPWKSILAAGASYVSVLTVANKLWDDIIGKADKAAQADVERRLPRSRFLSLFPDQQGRKTAETLIDRLRTSTGVGPEVAYGAGFALESQGIFNPQTINALINAIKSGQVQVENMEEIANSMGNMMKAFELKDFTETLDILGAAAKSSQADVGTFAKAMGEMGTLAEMTGTGFKELAALFQALGGDGVERLRTRVNALNNALSKKGIESGLYKWLQDFASGTGTVAQRARRQGITESRAIQGIALLLQAIESGRFGAGIQNINKAGGFFARTARSLELDPTVRYANIAAGAEQSTEVALSRRESPLLKQAYFGLRDTLFQELQRGGLGSIMEQGSLAHRTLMAQQTMAGGTLEWYTSSQATIRDQVDAMIALRNEIQAFRARVAGVQMRHEEINAPPEAR